MKGMLIKDIEFMKQQKQFFLMVIVMGIVLNISGSVTFSVGYFTILVAVFTNTTMSYDEYDNGMPFLLTLPIGRRQYVAEKYILGAGLTFLAWGIGTVLSLICNEVVKGAESLEDIMGGAATIPVAILMLAVFLPLSIRFGVEKGRYIAIALWIVVFAGIYAVGKTGIQQGEIVAWLDTLNWKIIFPASVLIMLAIYLASYKISSICMEKKEF